MSVSRLLIIAQHRRSRLDLASSVLRQGRLTRTQLLAAPKLKFIARNGTGYDSIDKQTCLEKGIIVTNNPGGNAIPVAEVCG